MRKEPRGANLEDADLRDADLRGVDLRGANLMYAIWTNTNLDGAIIDYRGNTVTIRFEANEPDATTSP